MGITLTEAERDLLAKVVWVEAQGECFEGQQAVAEVVLNRLVSGDFPDTITEVIYEKGQFQSVPYLEKATHWDIQYQAIESALYLSEMLPSGKQCTYDNRVAWAKTYLCKAGLIYLPKRGHCQITEEGKKALASGKTIDLPFLNQYKSFRDFHSAKSGQGSDHEASSVDTLLENAETLESPMEILDGAFKQVTNTLASELMDEVMKLTSSEFESMVVKLLLRMGYGSGIDNAGIVTKQSGDGGIDGIIKEDQLGFSSIYIQAKQWAPDRKVDRPEIQKFAGALQGEKATKGLFITTAMFTSGAKAYVENLRGSTIVLVDGNQLTHLMIKYNLGVSVEHIYEVKRIDTDFFAEGL